jgi:hypothetical protein
MRRMTGRLGEARELFDECMAVARDAGWRYLLWWPALGTAALAREEDDLDLAAEMLGRAASLCPKLGRHARQADCLDELASLRCRQGLPRDAAEALGAADATRVAARTSRCPVYHPTRDALLAELRSSLGETELAAAMAAGARAGAESVLTRVRA